MGKLILIVDDEQIILDTLSRDLRLEDYTVTTAPGGSEAISLLKDNHFDMVITDLIMPETGGLDVLQYIKNRDVLVGVIILTGQGDMSSAIEALRLGADDFLLKPYDIDELLLRIRNCFGKLDAFRKIELYENILPVCCVCGKIRDDSGAGFGLGDWLRADAFLHKKTDIQVSHSYCDDCLKKAMEEDL